MNQPINLTLYHDAVSGLRASGIEVREIHHNGHFAVRMADSSGVMKPSNMLAVIQRWKELR